TSSSPSRPRRGHRHGTPTPPTPAGVTPAPNGSRAPAPAQRSLQRAVGGRGRRSGPPLRAQAEGGLDQPPPACPTLGGCPSPSSWTATPASTTRSRCL